MPPMLAGHLPDNLDDAWNALETLSLGLREDEDVA